MPISFDSALGVHAEALQVRSRRAEVLASNMANAETPGYKARDIDFKSALAKASTQQQTRLHTTHQNHINTGTINNSTEVMYRVPVQSSLDGNTVDAQTEKTEFADNALRYEASLMFLDRIFKGMAAALKGE